MEDEPIIISEDEKLEKKAGNRRISLRKFLLCTLVLLLIGAAITAGYKWKSQIDEYKQNQSDRERQISELEQKLSQKNSSDSNATYSTDQFTFDIPKGWKIEEQKQENQQQPGETPIESYTISNPKTDFSVVYFSGPGGLGGGCDPEDQVQQQLVSTQALNNTKFAEKSYYSEFFAPNRTGEFRVWFGVTNKNTAGSAVCGNTSYMVTTLTDTSDNIFFFGGGLTSYDKDFADEASARAFLKSSDYLLAKKMILSLKSK